MTKIKPKIQPLPNGILNFIHQRVMYLNNSKFFAGIVMILLNIGSKFITVQFSKSTEEYMKYSVCKQVIIFAMSWMATRDIYVSLGLVAIFTVLSEYLFNEESRFCIVPQKYRVLHRLVDTNKDSVISESEITSAIQILERANKKKQEQIQKNALMTFYSHPSNDTPIPLNNL